VLSDCDLVALLLRTGSRDQDAWSLARHLLEGLGGLRGLESAPTAAIESIPGLGPAKVERFGPEILDIVRRQADFLIEFPIHCRFGAFLRSDSALRKLPSTVTDTAGDQHPTLTIGQNDANVCAITLCVDPIHGAYPGQGEQSVN